MIDLQDEMWITILKTLLSCICKNLILSKGKELCICKMRKFDVIEVENTFDVFT